MKIAVASDDARTVSQHFGRSIHSVVLTIENGHVAGREERDKTTHAGGHHDRGHESAASADGLHHDMLSPIADCEILVPGGMGAGAYAAIRDHGLRPLLTDLRTIEDVAEAFNGREPEDHPERFRI